MPPKPGVRSSASGSSAPGPVRRPMVGAAAAKAKKEASARPPSASKGRPAAAAKKGPASKGKELPKRSAGGPEKPSRSAPKQSAPPQSSQEDDRGVRRSHDEYMHSANERMQSLQTSLMKKGGGKTGLEDFEMNEDQAAEAADSAAMSMLDLLASLEGSGQTELGIFSGSVLQYSKDMGIRLSPEAIAAADPDDNHGVLLKCETRGMIFEDDSGTFLADDQGVALRLAYKDLKLVLWDHQHSSVKLRSRANEFVIITIENSLELEAEFTKRFAEAIDCQALSMNMVPAFSYLGMFAGPTKPKPFERKRANLTQLKQSKMPALTKMREIAVERHHGPERPMPLEFSRRTQIALDHIHEGQCMFPVFTASGPEIYWCQNAVLVIDDEGLVFENDTLNENISEDRRAVVLFENVSAWGIYDLGHDVVDNGIQLECKDGHYFFSVDDINNFRVCFEYFWNIHRTTVLKLGAQPGTTHGRKVVGIHTLMGEVKAPAVPIGNYQVMDADGKIVKANAPPKRKKSFLQKAAEEVFGSNKSIPTAQRGTVRPHWGKVVQHNGWLLKQGGLLKTWLKRYFVLYKTSQGHFLSYYSQYWESPLYNPDRKERNMIDLCKVTFLRARSKNKDVPPFSFDIATIEREWTVCADNNEDLQLWLQLIAAAVDEDVAIVPDDTLSFYVKARIDPSRSLDPNDYTTILQVSTWGVSVQKMRLNGQRLEVQFWCYTDFYKWYVMKQNSKTALSVQIFSEGNFKKKLEWVFRTPDAEKISTAIEYFIEKFMSRMHLRRELEEAMAPPPPPIVAPELPPPPPPAAAPNGGDTSAPTPSPPPPAAPVPTPTDPKNAVGSGDSGYYEVGKAPPELPAESQVQTSGPAKEWDSETVGGDLVALFEEEDEIPSASLHLDNSNTSALANTNLGNDNNSDGDNGGAANDGQSIAGTDWASDDEADEDDLLYAAYDVGMDVIDVDDPVALERAFSIDTIFFAKDYPTVSDSSSSPDITADHGITDEMAKSIKGWYKTLMTGIQGTLIKNDQFDLYYRHEYRGSQARITLMYKNLCDNTLTNFDVTLSKSQPMIRGPCPKHGETLPPQGTQTQLLVIELMTPYAEPPELLIAFNDDKNESHKYPVQLPVTLTHFLAPIILNANHFMTRWDAMADNETIMEGPTKLTMDPASFMSVQGKLRTIKFGLGADALDEDGKGLLCAAALHTKTRDKETGNRVLVGVMAMVLVVGKTVKVTLRCAAPKASELLCGCVIAQLE
eukprot:CAMPEP_0114353490 /NCGR_PEP_ID=MMETSP0101-20121206/18704_1 /TAXON_ID=38822 ORGANISM="Pteridomonas danica, Strain PT" /NCGR_SAMPLE_ID=MMETSP0101 /ASSEMBLY_ACC=CAM_ASM_000211 /LENGTH=1247 /DNA_ID=CAMNT_0001494355 /DNA_START=20 /DNA_END=3763 /DNA_ORIENTATION=-